MRFTTPSVLTASAGAFALAIVIGAGTPDRTTASATFPIRVETVTVMPGSFTFRQPGEYLRADRPIDAPLGTVEFRSGFDIMKFQVSAADYSLCVTDGGCTATDGSVSATPGEMPVTGVNYRDATTYAAWLSRKSGENWRLPTDAEWAFAAADRFADEALGLNDEGANPAARWLARYRSEADKAAPEPAPKPRGHFGINKKGLVDVSGNVWDWTTTCYVRASLNADGTIEESTENCGVRVVAGRHRGYMSHFIRDGKSGGCAAGMAPHNLGIRLIREQASLMTRFRKLLNGAAS